MTEIPKRSIETHPLWSLYKFITVEQIENFNRLEASDYNDVREVNFQVFLQEEAKDRLSQEIASDIDPGYKDNDTTRMIILNPRIRKEYEAGWKNLFLKVRIEPLNGRGVIRQIDSLFEIWNKTPKMAFSFSAN